jgi:hypothetical protein
MPDQGDIAQNLQQATGDAASAMEKAIAMYGGLALVVILFFLLARQK